MTAVHQRDEEEQKQGCGLRVHFATVPKLSAERDEIPLEMTFVKRECYSRDDSSLML